MASDAQLGEDFILQNLTAVPEGIFDCHLFGWGRYC